MNNNKKIRRIYIVMMIIITTLIITSCGYNPTEKRLVDSDNTINQEEDNLNKDEISGKDNINNKEVNDNQDKNNSNINNQVNDDKSNKDTKDNNDLSDKNAEEINKDNQCAYTSKGSAANTDESKDKALDSVKNYILKVISKSDIDDYDTKDYNENIEMESLFYIDGNWYIKAKIKDLVCNVYDVVEDEEVKSYKYEIEEIENKKCLGSISYELWKYDGEEPHRLLCNAGEIKYTEDDEGIDFDGCHHNYYVAYKTKKVKNENNQDRKIAYECWYTKILKSDDNKYICYFDEMKSVCAVDNSTKSIIFYEYKSNVFDSEELPVGIKYNNLCMLTPSRYEINEIGWIEDTNIAYISCYGMCGFNLIVDFDKKIVKSFNGIDSILDDKDGCIIKSTSGFYGDVFSYMDEILKKEYNYISMLNLHTYEVIRLGKVIYPTVRPLVKEDFYLKYKVRDCEEVTIDISSYISKKRKDIKKDTINYLVNDLDMSQNKIDIFDYKLRLLDDICFQVVKYDGTYYLLGKNYSNDKYNMLLEKADNIELYKCGNNVYAYVCQNSKYRVYKCMEDKLIEIANMRCDDINKSNFGDYISFVNNDGNTIILDSDGEVIFNNNVNDCLNNINSNDKSSVNNINEDVATNTVVKVTQWDSDNKNLYVYFKDNDNNTLAKLYCINLKSKETKNLIEGIMPIQYDKLYFDTKYKYLVYSTNKDNGNIDLDSNTCENIGQNLYIVIYDEKMNFTIRNIYDKKNENEHCSYYVNMYENIIDYRIYGENNYYNERYYIEDNINMVNLVYINNEKELINNIKNEMINFGYEWNGMDLKVLVEIDKCYYFQTMIENYNIGDDGKYIKIEDVENNVENSTKLYELWKYEDNKITKLMSSFNFEIEVEKNDNTYVFKSEDKTYEIKVEDEN